jgi:hypothetical protein
VYNIYFKGKKKQNVIVNKTTTNKSEGTEW